MLECIGMCLDMLLQVYVTVSRYVCVCICCYRSMVQCLGMCFDMLLQVYFTVSRYVFGYVVTGLCYSV